MNKQENKRLVKLLIEKKKEIKDKSIIIEKTTVLRKPRVDKKYVSDSDYKELVIIYDVIKDNSTLTNAEVENLIIKNSNYFPFLKKCNDSIYDFVTELRCGGPYAVAKEMSRQGREIDYINNHIKK